MGTLYIASDRRGAGRTALAAGLTSRLERDGRRVRLLKPLSLREAGDPPDDADSGAYGRLGLALSSRTVPVTSQDLEAGLPEVAWMQVQEALGGARPPAETVIVEGLPGLDLEGPGGRASRELAALLDARVIVVVGFAEDLSTLALSAARQLFRERLLGVVINRVGRYQGHWARTTLVPALEASDLPVLGVIPEDRRLLGVRVREIAEGLQGEVLQGQEHADALVEHFMIGANVLDDSTLYFQQRTRKAVLVRGDRPDIQMGALATLTTCLVLTGGKGPIQYVQHEAEQEGVPLVRVSQATARAAEGLEELLSRARFDHPQKLERYQELLQQHLNWELLRAAL